MLQSIKKFTLLALLFAITGTATFATAVDEWDGTTIANAFASGTGTNTNPYVINTGAQFAYFIKSIGNGATYSGKYVKLGNNIDLNSKLLPTTGDFNGDFNGDNHQLLNCVFTTEGYMFKNVYGVIRNLGLKSHFNKDYSSLTYSVLPNGLIFNCNHVFSGGKGNFNYSSAFAYQNHGQIVYCHAEGDATGCHWWGSSENGHLIKQGGLVYSNQSSGVILNCLSDIKSYYDGYKGNSYSTVADDHFLYQSNYGLLYNDVENDDTQMLYWDTWKSNHSTYSYNQKFDANTVIKTVTFHDSMGFYTTTIRQVNKGSAIGTLPVPEYDCTFNGWKVGSNFIYSTYIVNSDVTVEAAWTQNIKRQPTFENPEFLVEDPAHASYQWYKGIPNVTNYDDWTSTNTGNSTTDSNTFSVVAKKGNILSFDWKVSSETYDKLSVIIGYTSLVNKSGEESGSYEYIIPSDGTYTMKVSYTKDSSGSAGTDNASVTNIKLLDRQSTRETIADQSSNVFSFTSYREGENFFCIATYSNSSTELCSNVIVAPIDGPGICDTDVYSIANTIYINNSEASCGKIIELPVKMKNDVSATGFQFDLVLPDGITVAKDENGLYEIELSTERTTAAKTNTFGSSLMPDGSVRVLAASTHSYTFAGNDGEVCVIKLNIGEEVPEGEYPIIIKNIEISDNKSLAYTQDYVKSTLTVVSYMLGDANGDTKITVTDFTAVANAILGNAPTNYVAKAADVNSDGKVTVSDLTGIANIILYGSINPSSYTKRMVRTNSYAPEVYVPAFSIEPGNTIEVPVYINNGTTSFSAYQMDVNLPQGLSVSDIRLVEDRISDHALQCAIMENAAYRLLSYSTRGNEFIGNNGAVAILTISADNISHGNYIGEVSEIELGENGYPHYANSAQFKITVGDATGIMNVNNGDGIQRTYNASGVATNGIHKGINIVKYGDGTVKKSIVK